MPTANPWDAARRPPGPPAAWELVPVSVLDDLLAEFTARSRSGQIVNSEAEGDAMRAAFRIAADEVRKRIPVPF